MTTDSYTEGDSCQEEVANVTWSLEEEWDSSLEVKTQQAVRQRCGKGRDREGSGRGGRLRQWGLRLGMLRQG